MNIVVVPGVRFATRAFSVLLECDLRHFPLSWSATFSILFLELDLDREIDDQSDPPKEEEQINLRKHDVTSSASGKKLDFIANDL